MLDAQLAVYETRWVEQPTLAHGGEWSLRDFCHYCSRLQPSIEKLERIKRS